MLAVRLTEPGSPRALSCPPNGLEQPSVAWSAEAGVGPIKTLPRRSGTVSQPPAPPGCVQGAAGQGSRPVLTTAAAQHGWKAQDPWATGFLSGAGATPCRSAGGSLHDFEASLGDSAGGTPVLPWGAAAAASSCWLPMSASSCHVGPGLPLLISCCPSLRCRVAPAAWAASSSSPPWGRLAGFFAAPPSRASDQVVGNAGIWANVGCENHSWARHQLSSARTAGEPAEPRGKPIAVGRAPSPAGGRLQWLRPRQCQATRW